MITKRILVCLLCVISMTTLTACSSNIYRSSAVKTPNGKIYLDMPRDKAEKILGERDFERKEYFGHKGYPYQTASYGKSLVINYLDDKILSIKIHGDSYTIINNIKVNDSKDSIMKIFNNYFDEDTYTVCFKNNNKKNLDYDDVDFDFYIQFKFSNNKIESIGIYNNYHRIDNEIINREGNKKQGDDLG